MKLDVLTTMVRNRIRLDFDGVGDREIELLANIYVMAASVAAASPGPLSKYLFGFCHDYLCTEGRHEHVLAFEKLLLTDLGDMISKQIVEGISSGKIKAVPADPDEKLSFAQALGKALKGEGEMNITVLSLEEAKAKGFLPADFEPKRTKPPKGGKAKP